MKFLLRYLYTKQINQILKKLAKEMKVQVIDMKQISVASFADPQEANDMRHFGETTNSVLARYLLCSL